MLFSPYILVIGVSWIVAHLVKYTIATATGKKIDLTHQLFISGGMPSSHATTAVSVWTLILLKDGFESGLFGLATLVTMIICYDAVKVRRSSGEQGEAISAIIKQSNLTVDIPRAAKGHTPTQVFAGAVLGATIGIIVFIATT